MLIIPEAGIIFTGITNQVPIATISGGGVSFCAGGSASLSTVVTNNGTGTISYSWSPSTGLSSTTVSNPGATPASTTTYTLTITDGNGIINSPLATTAITINPLPTISGTLSVCAGSTTQLTGSATAAAFTPWVSATPAVATVSSTGLVTGVSAGTSVITYTNSNGCSITATVTVNALPRHSNHFSRGAINFLYRGKCNTYFQCRYALIYGLPVHISKYQPDHFGKLYRSGNQCRRMPECFFGSDRGNGECLTGHSNH